MTIDKLYAQMATLGFRPIDAPATPAPAKSARITCGICGCRIREIAPDTWDAGCGTWGYAPGETRAHTHNPLTRREQALACL